MEWMAWTTPTAYVFIGLGLVLVVMTVWELCSPSVPRRGWLPMVTTRGDRLFVGLVLVVLAHLVWAGTSELPWTWVSLPSALLLLLVMRFG